MSRINTNVVSLLAQRSLSTQNKGLNLSLQRLSTGFRINRGADDPAGLIASENLRAEKTAITAAIGNAERADQVINIAEGGLTEIAGLLNQLEGLVGQSANKAGLSQEEKEANQLQVDSILQTIDRIANSTSFQGTKLLNGTFDYTTSSITTSELSQVKVDAARIPQGGHIGVTVDVITSAQLGGAFLSGDAGAGTTLDNFGTGSLTIEIAGNKGIQQFTFASGVALTDVRDAINTFVDVTGVSATVSTNIVKLTSTAFGDTEFVSVTQIDGRTGASGLSSGTYAASSTNTTVKDFGRDATVNINGQAAQVKGLIARVASSSLDVTVTLAQAFNSDANSSTFEITGGGATFQLAPKLDLSGKASLGIQAVTTGQLGNATEGFLTTLKSGGVANVVDGDIDNAQRVVEAAIKGVSTLRGRLGSFQSLDVAATIRSLGVALENTSAAESQIRDTDFAVETANLTRQQILVQAATNVLSVANSSPQNVLALLRG
jgi:flagellin